MRAPMLLSIVLALAACAANEPASTRDSQPSDQAAPLPSPPPPPPAAIVRPTPAPGAVAPAEAVFPRFPCRPPDASDVMVLDRGLLARTADADLGNVADRLATAFARAGFPAPRLYATCRGFVAVSAVERARSDGRPFPQPRRFVDIAAPVSVVEDYSLAGVLRALLTVTPGRFRLIAIRVSDQPALPAAAPAPLSAEAARILATGGGTELPPGIAALAFGAGHRVNAYVYDFERRPGEAAARLLRPPPRPALESLERSGLLTELGR